MAYRLEFQQWVPFPLAQVFLFFANPHNLPRIMPPQLGANILRLELLPPPGAPADSPLAGTGSTAYISVRMIPFFPFRGAWVARIVEFEWNDHFADIQEKGPFKSWHHRHEFAAEIRDGVSGTLVGDILDYEIGFGPLGVIAQKLFVGRQMQQTFMHRQKILESLLATSQG